MITVEFGAWCSFGNGDSEDTVVAVELSEAEVERLRDAAKEWYWDDFAECEEVSDIYDKVREIAIDQITDELKEYQPGFTEMLGEGEKADSIYFIGVAWPEEMEPDEEDNIE